MKIIIHADDFGYNEDTCQATIDLFEKGVLKSATIMVNMPASPTAIEYAKKHPEFSFGVHLTYVDELNPVCNPKDIKSLVNKCGTFLPSDEMRRKALLLKLKREEIIEESIKQIEILQKTGIKVSHLDSHGHLHKFPAFLSALNDVSKKTGITKMRRVQNIFITTHELGASSLLNSMFGKYISGHFKSTDYFYMPANSMDTYWSDAIYSKISYLPNSILEIGVHPGMSEDWRVQEYEEIEKFAHGIERTEHKLINWNEL